MAEAHEYADAPLDGPVRGRGAGLNPGNRFESMRLHVLGEHLDDALLEGDGGPANGAQVVTQVIADRTRTIINYVDPARSPDIGFRWTINPYRGCEHGCIYCYARPGHEFLGMSCGLDFETKIMAKLDAADLLRRELASAKWRGEPIVMSGVTDCYQPIEAKLRLTRGCLQVMAQCRQPISLVTKNRLILRDLDVLGELARHRAVAAAVSVTTLDPKLAQKMEPRASSPGDRLHTIAVLAGAGIPVSVMVAPIIPGLNDTEVPRILEAAAEAGATSAAYVLLRLPLQIKALFLDWLARHYPQRAAHVEALIRDTRQGALYNATPGVRRRGQGPVAEQIATMFKLFKRRHGLAAALPPLSGASFRRPVPCGIGGQMSLF